MTDWPVVSSGRLLNTDKPRGSGVRSSLRQRLENIEARTLEGRPTTDHSAIMDWLFNAADLGTVLMEVAKKLTLHAEYPSFGQYNYNLLDRLSEILEGVQTYPLTKTTYSDIWDTHRGKRVMRSGNRGYIAHPSDGKKWPLGGFDNNKEFKTSIDAWLEECRKRNDENWKYAKRQIQILQRQKENQIPRLWKPFTYRQTKDSEDFYQASAASYGLTLQSKPFEHLGDDLKVLGRPDTKHIQETTTLWGGLGLYAFHLREDENNEPPMWKEKGPTTVFSKDAIKLLRNNITFSIYEGRYQERQIIVEINLKLPPELRNKMKANNREPISRVKIGMTLDFSHRNHLRNAGVITSRSVDAGLTHYFNGDEIGQNERFGYYHEQDDGKGGQRVTLAFKSEGAGSIAQPRNAALKTHHLRELFTDKNQQKAFFGVTNPKAFANGIFAQGAFFSWKIPKKGGPTNSDNDEYYRDLERLKNLTYQEWADIILASPERPSAFFWSDLDTLIARGNGILNWRKL